MKELIDKVYELEGLLELLRLRPEKIDALQGLIDSRLEAVNNEWNKVRSGSADAAPTVEDTVDEIMAAREDGGYDSVDNVVDDDVDTFETAETVGSEDTGTAESAEEPIKVEVKDLDLDNPVKVEVRDVPLRDRIRTKEEKRPRPALTINDRFRFARAVCDGNRARFDELMGQVADFKDFSQAEELFIDRMGLDPEDPDVADMLELLQKYYES